MNSTARAIGSGPWELAAARCLPGGADPALVGAFAERLQVRYPAPDSLDKHPVSDLFLAFACARGDRAALARFDREVLVPAVRVVARVDPAAEFQGEVAQALRARLLVREAGCLRIESYEGKSPLLPWVRAAAMRVALNLREGKWAERRPLDERWLATGASAESEASLLKDAVGQQFRAAFAEALQSLPARDRALLRMHVVEGTVLEDLALAYGVHRATVARWLATARGLLLRRTRTALGRAMGIGPAALESLLAFARSRLEVSLSGFLEDEG